MSEPTRQEIIDAHNALEQLCERLYGTRYAKMSILKVIPPLPQPTMAEVEWDDDKYFLAEAEHPEHGKVVMIVKGIYNGNIGFLFKDEDNDNDFLFTAPENLTPTGKKYVLLEM